MTEPRTPTQTASTTAGASHQVLDTATAGAIVKPDPRLAQAFITQAFFWMFIGLLVSAAVAAVVQVNPRLLDFAAENFFLIAIGQIAIVFGISFGITRINATLALGLFFVYAASMG